MKTKHGRTTIIFFPFTTRDCSEYHREFVWSFSCFFLLTLYFEEGGGFFLPLFFLSTSLLCLYRIGSLGAFVIIGVDGVHRDGQ